MELSIATEDVLDNVAELVNQAYRGISAPDWTSEVGLIDGPRTNRLALQEMIKNDASTILLALDRASGRLTGCVALSPLDHGEWYLSMLAVDPQSQSSGNGKSIMTGAEDFARGAGARSLKISVINVRQKLIEWYERRGFVKTGHTEAFPYDDPGVGVPLRGDLALVTLTKSLRA
ncbi:GNAT family N-acetyltransferase [Acerihabitans arboris]|uniref:GNAT family N-acetyltransferase n=1 Tax=Acerihabitans arboris TaxID=2691583 RepID=A0A845SK75_9GAMM|nr:GNAT family N-acetyltransferase [Acerihabitans arboris]NDL65673.1 GNAT family N-acetyltransferase [Acerihabitans arboris]